MSRLLSLTNSSNRGGPPLSTNSSSSKEKNKRELKRVQVMFALLTEWNTMGKNAKMAILKFAVICFFM